jgi:hypothetical protein
MRWRPEKLPQQCTFEQVRLTGTKLGDVLAA